MMNKIEYDRLLRIAKRMHLWIFLNSNNEQSIYDKLGLTKEENTILGYSGEYRVGEKE